jgi:hypothetical protein
MSTIRDKKKNDYGGRFQSHKAIDWSHVSPKEATLVCSGSMPRQAQA